MATNITLLASVKPGFTTISPARDVVASFDREGRLYSHLEKGYTYRRTLASTVKVRWREEDTSPDRGRRRRRRRLGPSEAYHLFERARPTAANVRPHDDEELRERLDKELKLND